MQDTFRNAPRFSAILKILLILVVGVLVVGFVFSNFSRSMSRLNGAWGWDFQNNLWGPSYLLLQGKSPYHIDQLFDHANSVWMPPAIGAFFSLGFLTLPQANNLWFLLTLVLFFVMARLSNENMASPILFAIAILALMLFPPFISTLWLGQYSMLVVVACLLAAEGIRRSWSWWAIGFLAVLALGKPQLMVLALPGLLVSPQQHSALPGMITALRSIKRRPVITRGIILLIYSLTLTIPLWIGYPNWLDGLIWASNHNPAWVQPSTLYVLMSVFGNFGALLWAIWLCFTLLLVGWMWQVWPPASAMRWTLALTTLVAPYIWAWDFVLLMPLLLNTLLTRRWPGKVVWFVGYILLLGGFLVQGSDATNDQFWWVPYAALAVINLSIGVDLLKERNLFTSKNLQEKV